MDNKGKNVRLIVVPSKLAPSAAVSISFPAPDLNWFVLRKLLPERPCGCATLASHSEYTAAVYAMYDDIRDTLVGTPDAQMKSKVNSVTCGYHNGMFIISYTCQSSVTAIRKSLGICMSRMSPQKRYPKYQKYIRLLGGKPDRAEFMNCAGRIAHTLKPCVFVVAKVKDNMGGAILEVIDKKFPDNSGIDSGKKPASESQPRGETEYVEVKTNGYESLFAMDFLDMSNIPALSTGSSIIIFKKFDGAKPEAIDRFVDTRYAKMKDKLMSAILYSATSRGHLCCPDLFALLKDNIKAPQIAKMIKSILT